MLGLLSGRRISILIMILAAGAIAGCGGSAESATSEPPTFTLEQTGGQRLFSVHCGSCHSTIPESVVVGPSMAGIASRAGSRIPGMDGREYVEESIMRPGDFVVDGFGDLMPKALAETLTKEEVDALIAFLMTLEE
jgi:mono/diheme cytochrome c family protein